MPKDQRKRQQIKQRDAARRKQKTHGPGPLVTGGQRALLRAAAHWPLYECLIASDWEKEGGLVQIVVARRGPLDDIGAAVILVDPGCLGVKNAYTRLLLSPVDYRDTLRTQVSSVQAMRSADLNLAAKIIRDSIAYARKLGFQPHPDYQGAAPFLDGAEPDRCHTPVPVGGRDGKPFFVSGPYDDVPRIMAQLERAVGPENFHYTVHLDPGAPLADLAVVDEIVWDDDADDEEGADEDSADEDWGQERPSLLRRLGLPFGR
jgi:hypothetical protein